MSKILLGVILVIIWSGLIYCDCINMVSKYFECSRLKMLQASPSFIPDPSLTGNLLDETFYAKQELESMSLDQAVVFFESIYNASTCEYFTCKCIASGIDSFDGKLSVFFDSHGASLGFKKMISDLNDNVELNERRKPDSEVFRVVMDFEDEPTTLAKFCSKYDVSFKRIRFYQDFDFCKSELDSDIYESWMYSFLVNKDVVQNQIDFSKLSQEKMLSYVSFAMLPYARCPLAQRRFYAMQVWSQNVPLMKWTGVNSADFFDYLLEKTRKQDGKPPIVFRFARMDSRPNEIQVSSFTTAFKSIRLGRWTRHKSSTFSKLCFGTKQTRIDCEWTRDPSLKSNNYELIAIKLTFIFSEFKPPKNVFVYKLDLTKPKIIDGSYIKNPFINNSNIIFLTKSLVEKIPTIRIYEFHTRTYLDVAENLVLLRVPSELLTEARGLLLDGDFKLS